MQCPQLVAKVFLQGPADVSLSCRIRLMLPSQQVLLLMSFGACCWQGCATLAYSYGVMFHNCVQSLLMNASDAAIWRIENWTRMVDSVCVAKVRGCRHNACVTVDSIDRCGGGLYLRQSGGEPYGSAFEILRLAWICTLPAGVAWDGRLLKRPGGLGGSPRLGSGSILCGSAAGISFKVEMWQGFV